MSDPLFLMFLACAASLAGGPFMIHGTRSLKVGAPDWGAMSIGIAFQAVAFLLVIVSIRNT
ncbi:conserved protein of unknown function (plasmid) [Rhodovastum atsumiense]|uniref:Uncharacterized protein n=1 Tax=Rhodovastum atsumiense TaxID=504468 RepID=A0A5M6ITG6_9PROT|nr:hypothetical protein [Rhodovastum atsumiense]KAA5611604.1 hypothetical protein F1189_13660 [Rhodovastum atsumiense]CAH2606311.1 conserved protein of unknown function [Rhodovastum atsumiense]